jgi:alpha-L-arabinofuranosidase
MTKDFVMQSDNLISYNSIEKQSKIALVEKEITNVEESFNFERIPQSFNVIVLNIE